MENKVRAIKRPVYFTISLIAFPFCLPCLPPVGTVQNTYTPMAHVCFRLYVVVVCFWCTPIRIYRFWSLQLYTHTHTHINARHFTLREMYIVERSLGTIDGKPCNVASFGCLSSYRKFRNVVSGYRSPRHRLPRWTGSIIEISRPPKGGMGRIFRDQWKFLFSFPVSLSRDY